MARVRVRNARYVPVLLRLIVRFRPGQDEGWSKQQLNEDLNRFLSPWAYEQGADLEIGGKFYANSIIDYVDRRDYVDYVAHLRLFTVEGSDIKAGTLGATGDYHVSASEPDTVLVAARQHHIEVLSTTGEQFEPFTGIGYMKIDLDLMVA
ncbi:MAG: hypothetical protein HC927_03380 [Deltaproteobacteria bacterium]|nr:hypothetical protein [Deltaproteobacteria bacterium]